MDVLMECCCGLDVHRDMVEACIIKGMLETPQIIREQFKTTRQELIRLTKWLVGMRFVKGLFRKRTR